MTQFLTLGSAGSESVRKYKQEVRAIVIDRAAFHVERSLARAKKTASELVAAYAAVVNYVARLKAKGVR